MNEGRSPEGPLTQNGKSLELTELLLHSRSMKSMNSASQEMVQKGTPGVVGQPQLQQVSMSCEAEVLSSSISQLSGK